MKRLFRATTATLIMFAGLGATNADQFDEDTAEPVTTPCFISGIKERVECLTLEVPLDYAQPEGQTISIHTAIIRARSSNPSPDPLWVFAGGPGQAASEYGILAKTAFREIRHSRDIVLVDQRGTGKSNPLDCELEPDLVMTKLEQWTEFVADCRKSYDIDVSQFTMEHVVRDMEVVREALGYDTLNVWGGSWGTRTASLYLRRYPQRVRSVIVDGVAPPDVSLFETAPASAERAVRLLAQHCASSPACAARFPDVEADIDAFVAMADAGTLRYEGADPLSGRPIDLNLSFTMAVESIRATLYAADATITVPLVISEAVAGNMTPLAGLMSSGSAADSMYIGATLSILCGEEVPRTRPEKLSEAAADSFARDSYFTYWAAGCVAWDAVAGAPDAHNPIASDVPALVLSGDLDPVTPPSMGEHWVRTFPNGRHIVVAGTGHITSRAACMPRLMNDFLGSLDPKALDTACLDHLERQPVVLNINGSAQ